MNIPETFKPNKKCEYNLEELDKKRSKKIGDIRSLILEPGEVGKNYYSMHLGHETKQEFNNFFHTIKWDNIEDNILRMYEKPDYDKIRIHILEYLNPNVLEENLDKIREEISEYNKRSNYFIMRVLTVDKYALVLNCIKYNEKDLDRVENVYKQRFGAEVIQTENS